VCNKPFKAKTKNKNIKIDKNSQFTTIKKNVFISLIKKTENHRRRPFSRSHYGGKKPLGTKKFECKTYKTYV